MPPQPRSGVPAHRRAAAWIYTGPAGHLWSTTADICVAWARWGAGLARRRIRGVRYSKR